MIFNSCFPNFTTFNQFSVKFGYITTTNRIAVNLGGFTLATNQSFDIQDGLFRIKNAGFPGGAVETAIRGYITSGQLYTSYNTRGLKGIGYRLAGNGDLIFGFALPGDCNLTGGINIPGENPNDSQLLSVNGKFNTGEPAKWHQGDFNYDGVFDSKDTALMATTIAAFPSIKYLPLHSTLVYVGGTQPTPQPNKLSYEGYRLPGSTVYNAITKNYSKTILPYNYNKSQDPLYYNNNLPNDQEGFPESASNVNSGYQVNWGLLYCSKPTTLWYDNYS
jgi:hypothetical protein